MQGAKAIIQLLNAVLTNELTSVNQYYLHARMYENWGFSRLGKVTYDESIGEMKHAEPRRGLLLTAAAFEIERASSYLNSANVFVQDARAKYRGVEVSAFGELTASLSIAISGLYLDAEQVAGPAAILGKRVENTPGYSGSAFVEYKLSNVPGLAVSGGLFYVGKRAVNALNQAFVPGYTTFDLGASYAKELLGRPTTLRVYGENITGKRYWAATGSNLAAQAVPRTVRFSISTAF